jgi:hypothetical protein
VPDRRRGGRLAGPSAHPGWRAPLARPLANTFVRARGLAAFSPARQAQLLAAEGLVGRLAAFLGSANSYTRGGAAAALAATMFYGPTRGAELALREPRVIDGVLACLERPTNP